MKKKFLLALFAGLSLTLSACGKEPNTETPATDSVASKDTSGKDSVAAEDTSGKDSVTAEETSDKENMTAEDSSTKSDETADSPGNDGSPADGQEVSVFVAPTKVSVAYSEDSKEYTAEDGTILMTESTSLPTVTIEGAADIADKINADLAGRLNPSSGSSPDLKELEEYYETVKGDDEYSFMPYEERTDMKTTRKDDSVVSFEAVYYSYTGGAHANYVSIGLNYDVRTGEPISFDELSDDPEAFHAAALSYLTELSKTPVYAEKMYPPDIAASESDFEATLFSEDKWFFSNSGLVFISDPYALGPYAYGTIYFTIPYSDAYAMGLKDEYAYHGNYSLSRYYMASYDPETGEQTTDGTPEYYFDLNGDGTEEGIAFYGSVYVPAENPDQDGLGHSQLLLYIDGKEAFASMNGQLDLSGGFTDSRYLLYDLNPDDSYVEIGVPFTTPDESMTDYPTDTYFFRYTENGELIYIGMIDGNAASDADVDYGSLR